MVEVIRPLNLDEVDPKNHKHNHQQPKRLAAKKAFYVWSNLDTGSVEIISKWIHMNGPAYHVHVVATRVLGICLLFFNEMLFKLRIQINFFYTKNEGFFFSRFMIYYLPSAIEKTYTLEMRLRMQIMIYQNLIFSDIFFFLIYCRNTILMRYDTTRIKTSNKIGKIIIWYMREFCEYNFILSFCI